MKLTDTYYGDADPFEGDRKIWLRSLPAGARVTGAFVSLVPRGGPQFQMTFVFGGTAINPGELPADNWSINQNLSKTPSSSFLELDFNARRTLASVQGSQGDNIKEVDLQVDMGGAYVGIANDGTFKTPDKDPWTVSLSPASSLPLPGLAATKFGLSGIPSENTKEIGDLHVTKVTVRSVPNNVSLRLADNPPFWMRLGELAASQTSPDFAAVLNAFLADAAVKDGYYQIPLIVHSDTISRLDVLLDIDYVIEETVLPSYLPETTLPYSYSSLPGAAEDLLTVKLPRGARPVSGTGGRIQGTFDSSRVVFGDIGESGAKDTIIVSPDSVMACPIQLEKETPVNGIDLPLANTDPGLAGLHLSLQEDLDGTPSGKILVEAEVKVARPVPGGSTWGCALLPDEFRFLKDKRCWLVMQSLSGQAFWTVRSNDQASVALLASTDGGFSWHAAATSTGLKPLQAVFRLRHTPDHFTMPVQLQIGKGAGARRVRFDRFAPLGRVEFDMDFASELNEYLASLAAASTCGKGNLLVNGSFDLPPHTDATRRLFGFDAGVFGDDSSLMSKVCIKCKINLSQEHFITLSACGNNKRIIDCAGNNSARTGADEIRDAICNAEIHASLENGFLILDGKLEGTPVLYPWLREQVPSGWNALADDKGQIWRLKMPTIFCNDWTSSGLKNPRPERVAVVLVAAKIGDDPAVLSQLVPAVGGCAYFLRIHFLSSSQAGLDIMPYIINQHMDFLFEDCKDNTSEPPSWEVRWLDCKGEIISAESRILSKNKKDLPDIDGMIRRETRLIAPSAAKQAEIRLIQPSMGFVLLDDVSFEPTYEALSNGTFTQWEIEAEQLEENIFSPIDWTRVSGELDTPIEQLACIRLMSNGPEDSMLVQRFEAKEGEHLQLNISARPDVAVAPADDIESQPIALRARLELQWMADGAATGEIIALPLDGRDFIIHSWAGEAPVGANGGEIRLIQPRGSGILLVESVSLQHSDQVPVDLVFLSEAPGELVVSNLKVAYELQETPSSPSFTRSSRIVSKGDTAAIVLHTLPQAVAKPEFSTTATSSLADLDISAVKGISEYTANTLKSLPKPITTVAELADLNPETDISGISRESRLNLKTSAEIVNSIYLEAAAFSGLANQSLAILWDLTAEHLVNRSGLQPEHVVQLQRNLRSLKLLLKNDAFRKLSLSDLIVSGRG